MKSVLLGFASLGCSAQDIFLERDATLLTPFVQTFSCDHECIKTEARLQGVDILTSLDNIQYSMEVVFQDDNSVSGDACGKTNLQFPPYRVAANPSIGTKITTTETRMEPSIVFECEPGKIYHLLMSDAMGGGFQNTIAYNHWLKLNLVCEQNGQAKVENNGRDVVLGAPNIPGWYSGKGYLPPGFPFNSFHHFGFYIYETATPFTDAELDQIDVDFQIHNVLGGPIPAYLVEEVAAFLKFTAPPVALTWIDVTTSYYSQVRMAKAAALSPQLAGMPFYKNICPCNLASSFPGLLANGLHFAGASECNL